MINASGALLTSISDTDLRLMNTLENFSLYGITVSQFLHKLRPSEPECLVSVTENTMLSKHRGGITYTLTSSLADVPALLQKNHIHRVYIVDGGNKPLGVITLKDLLAHLRDIVGPSHKVW